MVTQYSRFGLASLTYVLFAVCCLIGLWTETAQPVQIFFVAETAVIY
jgi:hypothetical protein